MIAGLQVQVHSLLFLHIPALRFCYFLGRCNEGRILFLSVVMWDEFLLFHLSYAFLPEAVNAFLSIFSALQ
jgi:hypothetical protein